MFLAISAFATLPSFELYNPAFEPVDALIDIFALVAGMVVILRCFEKDLREGPLKGFFPQGLPLATIQSHRQPLIEQLSYIRACLSDDSLAASSEDKCVTINMYTWSFVLCPEPLDRQSRNCIEAPGCRRTV